MFILFVILYFFITEFGPLMFGLNVNLQSLVTLFLVCALQVSFRNKSKVILDL